MSKADHEWLAEYCRGDLDALAKLVEHYRRPLYGYILNMTEGNDDAEEIFQEVWLRVIRRARFFKKGNFPGWLFRIAHNLVIDRARRRRPSASLESEPDSYGRPLLETIPSHVDPPDQHCLENELADHITRAVRRLPPRQREVFLMRTRAGLTFKQIARIQRVPLNTALARMHYAVAALRRELRGVYQEIGGGQP